MTRGGGSPRPCGNYDRFHAVKVGEAKNPGPLSLAPWDPDPKHTSRFAIFGEGWVVFIFKGPIKAVGPNHFAFLANAPLGEKVATSHVVGESHLYQPMAKGSAYICAEARPIQPQREGTHEFQIGHPGSRSATVQVQVAPSGLAWKTGSPGGRCMPWTHADLACGIGGFTVAAQELQEPPRPGLAT